MQTISSPARQSAIETARQICAANPIYMDTETTGLDRSDEIIEISIVDHDGKVLFESLIKPSRPIPDSATRIHGITNADVQNARSWPLLWPQIRGLMFGRKVVLYNEDFDMRMMQQTHRIYHLPWKDRFDTFDLMRLYAQYHGEWDSHRRGYRSQSLANAGRQCGIVLPNAHRSTADTLLTRAVLIHIAHLSA
jgi:DNA polymerase III subunit epsilon